MCPQCFKLTHDHYLPVVELDVTLERSGHRWRFRIALMAGAGPARVCIVQVDDDPAEVTELANPEAEAIAWRVCVEAIDQALAEGWTIDAANPDRRLSENGG